jgi:hypothetical protein
MMLLVLWIGTILTCLAGMARYESTPGAAGTTPVRWPDDVEFRPTAGHGRMLLFAHPQCPCTRSSLAELERLLDRRPNRPQATIVFVQPETTSSPWSETSTWKRARAMNGVEIICDVGGRLSRRFGAATSGHVLLYDENGALQYSGGVTSVRGQEGPCLGTKTLSALLQGDRPGPATGPVYGCPLHNATRDSSVKGAARCQP